ncbi:MAG: class I SAM-dependent methyltransferase [Methylacidiphilales bacterium]|nr:class I SAM-dependent methyltransferase [Candidatus Methylacidiphilales bacterium]
MSKVLNFDAAYENLSGVINSWENNYQQLSILEAGGGSLSKINFHKPAHITVIDISKEQLERNDYAEHKICGDLHTVVIPKDEYDAVVCYDVIEHLENPHLVITKLIASLKCGGIMILAAPKRDSLSGAITAYTPHWFHVWVHRYLFKNVNAGNPGCPPFRAVFNPIIAPQNLSSMLQGAGMQILLNCSYESSRREHLRLHSPVFGRLYDSVIAAGNLITGKKLEESDFFIIAKKT